MKITAVLNDLDGLLVNSEQLYLEANQIYFKKFGKDFTAAMHGRGAGRKFDVWIKTVYPDLSLSGEQILNERNEVFFELAEEKLALLPGVREYLEMASRNFKNALVTSSRQDYLDIVFRKTGIHTCFDLIIDGSMVQRGKPDPEGYLIAARELGEEPENCLVFEDAPSGVLSGKAAGMRVVNIPSPYVKDDPDLKRADFHFDSMEDVSLEWIRSLV
jgi:HAD superfamily hydrolase (TIGR01509 family)